MQLWTDYEGVTLDGAFPLKKLLMPEGRSAFFSTATPTGEPTVVRLIECHFDEEEILARWRCIDALHHPNFLKFERFGQTELDGRPVVYAVFEKVDGNLAEVLDQGTLSLPDVAQLASSLVAALEVLHTHGFVHEHIEPRNIFALGTAVKLRGDCIREAPEADEGRIAKQRDVRALATVLLQGLTQRDSLHNLPDSALPAPFAHIIRNGISGAWGLDNIRAALGRQFGANQPPTPKSTQPAPSPQPSIPAPETAATNGAAAKPSAPKPTAKPAPRPDPQLSLPLRNPDRNPSSPRTNPLTDDQPFSLGRRWIAVSIAALVLLLVTLLILHTFTSHPAPATPPTATTQPTPTANRPTTNPTPAVRVGPVRAGRPGWRVIAFTYNHRADADKKVSDLARSHPDLAPTLFTPTGRPPYLVSIGGIMDRDAAQSLARRSRSLGLPRDLYAQNYTH